MMIGIYAIRHGIRFYVGQSRNVHRRLRGHRSSLVSNRHKNPRLQAAWNKYGQDGWEFCIIEECDPLTLTEREQWWMDVLDAVTVGFNCGPASNPMLGHRPSDETRRLISQANRNPSLETRLKMSASRRARPPASKETRRRQSESQKGKTVSPETRAKLSAINKNKHVSDETRRLLSESWKRRAPISPETRQKMFEGRQRFYEERRKAQEMKQNEE